MCVCVSAHVSVDSAEIARMTVESSSTDTMYMGNSYCRAEVERGWGSLCPPTPSVIKRDQAASRA